MLKTSLVLLAFILSFSFFSCVNTIQKKQENVRLSSQKPSLIGKWQMLDAWHIDTDGSIYTPVVDTPIDYPMDYVVKFYRSYFLNDSTYVHTAFSLREDTITSHCKYTIHSNNLYDTCIEDNDSTKIQESQYFFILQNNTLMLLSHDFRGLSLYVKIKPNQDINTIIDSINKSENVFDSIIKLAEKKGKCLYQSGN